MPLNNPSNKEPSGRAVLPMLPVMMFLVMLGQIPAVMMVTLSGLGRGASQDERNGCQHRNH